ncbi:hypothetical protein EVAR_39466_1 [Eumeta japonica]|uniref:Uncharacterized protein n=1 Tax=Eumeta variegata TaxID=151549 RepID=A0A4C1VZI7_EUMVA|nr:hypothetical protein EVAR_39466_1 [Eumeta japonica]
MKKYPAFGHLYRHRQTLSRRKGSEFRAARPRRVSSCQSAVVGAPRPRPPLHVAPLALRSVPPLETPTVATSLSGAARGPHAARPSRSRARGPGAGVLQAGRKSRASHSTRGRRRRRRRTALPSRPPARQLSYCLRFGELLSSFVLKKVNRL